MSSDPIRAAFEKKLATMTPALETAYENVEHTPTVGCPYQKGNLMMAAPDNATYGEYYRERGFYQLMLCYPPGVGAGDARKRADAVQKFFKRGLTLPLTGSNYLTVNKTPAIGPGMTVDDRYCIPVSIPFFAEIFN